MVSKFLSFCLCLTSAKIFPWLYRGCWILCLIATLIFGFDFLVKPIFVYPEEQYRVLENEVQRITEEKTLSSEYRYKIEYPSFNDNPDVYVSVTNMDITTAYGAAYVSARLKIDDYGTETQTISVKRAHSQIEHYLVFPIVYLLLITFLAAMLFFGLAILFYLMFGICCVIDAFRKRKFKEVT